MLNQPPEPNAQDVISEHGIDSDAAQTINCKRAAILLSLVLSALPAGALAKNTSSIIQDHNNFNSADFCLKEKVLFMNWKNLMQMSWEEIEEKLKVMSWPEKKRVLDLLSRVAKDARLLGESEIADKLKQNKLLDEEKKEFFLEMAEKYEIDGLSALKSILDQDQLTSDDFQFVLLKLKELAGKKRHIAGLYVKTRGWLSKEVEEDDIFDSKEDLDDWMEDSNERIQDFKNLVKALMSYERSLDR